MARRVTWQRRGYCYGEDPRRWETENLTPGREAEEAEALCAGCPVKQECAQDAVQPIPMPAVYRRNRLGEVECVQDSYAVMVSGVVRAGVPT